VDKAAPMALQALMLWDTVVVVAAVLGIARGGMVLQDFFGFP